MYIVKAELCQGKELIPGSWPANLTELRLRAP